MRQAIDLAVENVRSGRSGPFGALVMKGDRLIASGVSAVVAANDPTAHAEVAAIREARSLGLSSFTNASYTQAANVSDGPWGHLLGAIYWTHPKAFYFASSRQAAATGFDDARIYELTRPPEMRRSRAVWCQPIMEVSR